MVDKSGGEVELEGENHSLKEKSTALKRLVRTFELRLKGHKWTDGGNSFGYTGDVLAGDVVIQKATALLQPFCEEVNLITNKEKSMWSKQKYRVRRVMNDTLMADGTSLSQNYSAIMQIFDDTLQNIGDVIIGSRDLVKPSFGGENPEEDKRGVQNW